MLSVINFKKHPARQQRDMMGMKNDDWQKQRPDVISASKKIFTNLSKVSQNKSLKLE